MTTSTGVLALIPLIPGVVPLMTYLGASAQLATAIDFSLVLHAAVIAITFDKSGGPATSITSPPITARLNPAEPLPIQAGWVPPVGAGNPFPTPPPEVGSTESPFGVIPESFSTLALYCSSKNFGATIYYPKQESTPSQNGGCWLFFNGVEYHNLYFSYPYKSNGPMCPTSYTLKIGDSTKCILNDVPLVKKLSDGNCQIARIVNSFSVDPRDPDCVTGSPTMASQNLTILPNILKIIGEGGKSASLTINPDGSSFATESYPDIATNSTNTLTTNYSSPADDGTVTLTGVSKTSEDGVGTLDASSLVDPSVPADPALLASIETLVDQIQEENDASSLAAENNPSLLLSPDNVAGLGLPTSNTFSSILPDSITNFLLPTNSENCVPLDVNLTYIGNLHISPCAVVDVIRPMINYLIIALGVIGGVLVWLKSDEVSA